MTVIHKEVARTFKADEAIWGKQEFVEAVVRSALVGQTEAFIDMISDTELGDEVTRASVNERLRGVKESAQDFLDDVLADLRIAIMSRLEAAQYGAVVTGIKYDITGDVVDIEVDVSVDFKE
jgi:hypothetical protein